MARLVTHLRSNVVGYIALAIALGGGGGYALAATTNSPSGKRTACVSNKNGAMFLKRSTSANCSKGQRKVIWNTKGPRGSAGPAGATGATGAAGPAGAPGSADAISFLGSNLGASDEQPSGAVTVLTNPSPGVYNITLSNPTCVNPVVTPVDAGALPAGDGATAYIYSIGPGATVSVRTGEISSAGFTPSSLLFTFHADCPGS
jgi:hypothetical protein